ncbi:hypothetical protein ACGF1Z_26210 [Streptomyces sp. NPDC048018]|uniref:hypothetical protein n=1 Tax=Streptomyces sp. NPDC048018 TaxID=3365499 RepID=UPI00371718CF
MGDDDHGPLPPLQAGDAGAGLLAAGEAAEPSLTAYVRQTEAVHRLADARVGLVSAA